MWLVSQDVDVAHVIPRAVDQYLVIQVFKAEAKWIRERSWNRLGDPADGNMGLWLWRARTNQLSYS